ncbi:hypothetical protein FJW10_26290 [Mesorhizobium sp. B4-1-1]|nr:hypothetical protein FJW10_26290 [Mesorhizobium sp. B4-1-1]
MPAFGISAFLRIVHMNARPQLTELYRRSTPKKGGYDFHNSLRRLSQLLMSGESLENVLAAAMTIVQPPERQSAQLGLRRLATWRAQNPGAILDIAPVTVQSPEARFSVTFTPNFGLRIADSFVAIHVWNTVKPRLEERLVRAILSSFQPAYRATASSPDDIAVLCLRTMRPIRLGDASDVAGLGQLIFANIDSIFRDIAATREGPRPASEDRPTPPPGE